MNRKFLITVAVFLTIILSGCASTRPFREPKESRAPTGNYYEVKRGDTLWKISKLYDIEASDIVKANRLPNAATIDVGQKLFIPSHEIKRDYSRTVDAPLTSGTFSWPVAGKVITYFGDKKGLVVNKGIDIEAMEGSDVVAADGGTVSFVDENMKGLGKTIIIDHENGFSTVYAHNSEILSRVGQKVKRNQVIARVGKTGRAAKPYLHFQIRKGHEPQNPFHYLP